MSMNPSNKSLCLRSILAGICLMLNLLTTLMLADQSQAQSQELGKIEIPQQLVGWDNWVRDRHIGLDCPTIAGVRHCIWPSSLAFDVSSNGGSFDLQVDLAEADYVRLPGSKDVPPHNISVITNSVTSERSVIAKDGFLYIPLPKGSHQIRGNFTWSEIPKLISVPDGAAVISLKIKGSNIDSPKINERVELSLDDGREQIVDDQKALIVTVFRKIVDDRPILFDSRINLRVSGGVRDLNLGKIIPEQVLPVSITSSLNVQRRENGDFWIQLKPGSHFIEVGGVVTGDVKSIVANNSNLSEWPESEVWSWNPREDLRSVEVIGGVSVDPERAEVPYDWRGNSHYMIGRGEEVKFELNRRGEENSPPNALQLQREMWLRLDGKSFATRDTWSGVMNQGWRLDAQDSLKLGQVKVANEGQVITLNPDNSLHGVEVRDQTIDVTGEGEILGRSKLSAVGWNHDVESLAISLNLPPGWKVWHVSGADRVYGSWSESWTLLDLFLALLLAGIVYKLFGVKTGLLSLIVSFLLHSESGAPDSVWFFLIVGVALLRFLPEGRLKRAVKVYSTITVIAFLLITVGFSIQSIRNGLFPQLDNSYRYFRPGAFAPRMLSAPAAVESKAQEGVMYEESDSLAGSGIVSKDKYGSIFQSLKRKNVIDPNSIVQNAPGVPNWRWQTVSLQWSGGVGKQHDLFICLSGPMVNLLLSFLKVLGVLALGFAIIRGIFPITMHSLNKGSVAGLALFVLSFMQTLSADAQNLPSTQLLTELENRITSQVCKDNCGSIGSAKLEVNGYDLSFSAIVEVVDSAALALPGPFDQLRLQSVEIDGQPAKALRRDLQGFVWIKIGEGTHKVNIKGKLSRASAVTLQFPSNPTFIEVSAEGWSVDGVNKSGSISGSIQLSRLSDRSQSISESKIEEGDQVIPSWFVVTREVNLSIPWEVTTQVRRLGSFDRPASLSVALLDGESVSSQDFKSEAGKVSLQFARGVQALSWSGILKETETLSFKANSDLGYSEEWVVNCTSLYRCSSEGIPPTYTKNGGIAQLKWNPYSGESLKLGVLRPEGVPGSTTTVDNVSYRAEPGIRTFKGEIDLVARTSQGGNYKIDLPSTAKVYRVAIDGTERAFNDQNGSLTFSLNPGSQNVSISFQIEGWKTGFRNEVPAVKLSSPASNVTVSVQVPSAAWLVWLVGPSWGGVVLFWSKILVIIGGAFLLSKIKSAPIGFIGWCLLGFGMATSSVANMLIPVGWFALFIVRSKRSIDRWWKFDLFQIFLAIYTLITISALYGGIASGLLVDPDMKVAGLDSTNELIRWYVDITEGDLPQPAVYMLPIWIWRGMMLLWSSWLVIASLRWAKWGFESFKSGGIWRPRTRVTE